MRYSSKKGKGEESWFETKHYSPTLLWLQISIYVSAIFEGNKCGSLDFGLQTTKAFDDSLIH